MGIIRVTIWVIGVINLEQLLDDWFSPIEGSFFG